MSTPVTGGDTDVTQYFVMRLAATGVGATALDVTTFDLQYVRNGVAPVAKVDATALAATDSAHADNKAIEIDATDQPGLYRVDWPDAAFAAGVPEVVLTVKCATCFTEHLAVPIDSPVNVTKVSDDSTAADNLELMYDGTGYTDDTAPASRSQVDGIGAAAGTSLPYANDGDNVDGAIKGIVFDGVETSGTNASVDAEDGTYHQIDDVANNIDIVYEFPVGGGRTATSVLWKGKLLGANDVATVQAYNGSSWATIFSLEGRPGAAPTAPSDNSTVTIPLLSKYTGTGADLGKVFIRFECAGQTNPALYTDLLLVNAVNIGQTVGYANGRIHVNTAASNTNTEAFVDGVADNPVSTWAAALTLSASVGLNAFGIATGSSITLTANSDGYALFGEDWDLGLGGQSIEGLHAHGANITGTGTATVTRPTFENCHFAAATIPPAIARGCGIGEESGTFTAGSAGQYIFDSCYSMVPGAGSPAFAFSGLGAATGINNRGWRGSATWTLDSDCTLSHEVLAGGGTTVTTGGADVEIRGITRSVTLTLSGAGTVQFVGVAGPIAIGGTATTTVNLYGVSASLADTSSGTTVTDQTVRGPDVTDILEDTAEIVTLLYLGPQGPGVYLDDAVGNTNTVVGVDGRESNPVSTIAAATTIAGTLGIQRIYLVNDSSITLAQTYEGWDFRGLGLSNQIDLGSQDVDNSCFCFVTLTGTQGGTGLLWTQDCGLDGLVDLQCVAFQSYLTGNNSLRASTMTMFDACKSAVAGNATPEITFTGAVLNLNFRHYSGGLTVKSMAAEDTMSYESTGQLIVDASCTGGLIAVRGACDVTDNAEGRVTIVQTAAINRANIEAAVTTSITPLVDAAENRDVAFGGSG